MRVFIGPPGEPEVSGGIEKILIERHEHDDFARAIAHIALVYLRHDEETRGSSDGVPVVDDLDVPEAMRGVASADERWAHVRGEIVWAMEQTLRGDEVIDDFTIEPGDYAFLPSGPGRFDIDTRREGEMDMDGFRAHAERVRDGMRLFADYMGFL